MATSTTVHDSRIMTSSMGHRFDFAGLQDADDTLSAHGGNRQRKHTIASVAAMPPICWSLVMRMVMVQANSSHLPFNNMSVAVRWGERSPPPVARGHGLVTKKAGPQERLCRG